VQRPEGHVGVAGIEMASAVDAQRRKTMESWKRPMVLEQKRFLVVETIHSLRVLLWCVFEELLSQDEIGGSSIHPSMRKFKSCLFGLPINIAAQRGCVLN